MARVARDTHVGKSEASSTVVPEASDGQNFLAAVEPESAYLRGSFLVDYLSGRRRTLTLSLGEVDCRDLCQSTDVSTPASLGYARFREFAHIRAGLSLSHGI